MSSACAAGRPRHQAAKIYGAPYVGGPAGSTVGESGRRLDISFLLYGQEGKNFAILSLRKRIGENKAAGKRSAAASLDVTPPWERPTHRWQVATRQVTYDV